MAKRILSLLLCVVLLAGTLAGCKTKTVEKDIGGYITMYLTDEIYDFDPANAYYNANLTNVLSLMFATLFRLTDSGNVEKYLVDSYQIFENKEANEYYMELKLKDTYWSVRDALTAEDVVFAWKRLVNSENNYAAAALLYDIKNARAVKEGDASIDDLGVEAVAQSIVKVTFEGPIDYDAFIRNLTSVATAPLLSRYVSANPYDWAKKPSSIATSGPFKLSKISYASITDENGKEIKVEDDYAMEKDGTVSGKTSKWATKKLQYFVLERNSYFDRDLKRDQVNATVTPYRLLVDCTKTADELLADYNDGKLFYIGSIPLSLRNNETVADQVEVSDALSTFVCYLNENQLIGDEYLFANKEVRQALSMAIDREAIAQAVVYAKAADALVPYGVFEKGDSGEFRKSKSIQYKLSTTAQMSEAKNLLKNAGITPSNYSFSVKVAAYSTVHTTIVEKIVAAWNELGFKVTMDPITPIQNNDMLKEDDKEPTKDICDDLLVESIQRGTFDVVAFDACAMTADAYSVLANYAYAFSGGFYSDSDSGVYEAKMHVTGYNSVDYNVLMESIYYLPYFAAAIQDNAESSYLTSHLATKPYADIASSVEHKLTAAATSATSAIQSALSTVTRLKDAADSDTASMNSAYSEILTAMLTHLNSTSSLQPLTNDLSAANADASLTNAAKTALNKIFSEADSALTAVTTAQTTATEKKIGVNSAKADLDDYYAKCDAAIAAYQAAVAAETAAASAAKAVAEGASQMTLKEAIEKVYSENEIDYTVKISKQETLRSKLLHKAEEMLLKDLTVIPVVYNQNATMTSKALSKVRSSYYCVSDFQKAKMKNADEYVDENGDSIFKNFPEILWDNKVQ